MWPFKKKNLTPVAKPEPYTVTLDSNDTPRERAIKICQAAGLVINNNVYNNFLPVMEQALEFYQKHDRLHHRKKKKGE